MVFYHLYLFTIYIYIYISANKKMDKQNKLMQLLQDEEEYEVLGAQTIFDKQLHKM